METEILSLIMRYKFIKGLKKRERERDKKQDQRFKSKISDFNKTKKRSKNTILFISFRFRSLYGERNLRRRI